MRPEEARSSRVSAGRVVASLAICFGHIGGSIVWLKTEGPIVWVFLYAAVVEALFLLLYLARVGRTKDHPQVWQGVDRWARIGIGLLLLLGAGLILVGLNITPASAYLAWFQLVREGVAGGTLAYMFTVKFAYFASLFSGMLLVGSAGSAILNLAAIDLLIAAVLLGKPGLAAIGVILFLFSVARRAARRKGRPSTRAALGVIQVSIISALIALPISVAHLRNGLIDDFFSFRMEATVAALFPSFPFLYNVPGYGYSLASSEIGGRPVLTSRPVFQITAPKGSTIYVRTGVYDTYTGTGWTVSRSARRAAQREIPAFTDSVSSPPPLRSSQIVFKVLIDFSNSLPHALNTVAFRFPNEEIPKLGLAGLASGFIADRPLLRGTTIIDLVALPGQSPHATVLAPRTPSRHPVPSETTNRRESTDGSQVAAAQLKYGIQATRFFLTPWERTADLQTGKVPERLVELARRLGAGKTHDQTIQAIRDYLLGNLQYSLDTSPGGPYRDAVSDFLFHSKKGFCVQFASAFVILARLNGIPARYVTGFLAEMPADANEMTLTGLSAHSWAETWDSQAGWVTQEATPPVIAAALGNRNVLSEYNPTDSALTRRQLEAVLGQRLAPMGSSRATPQGSLSTDIARIGRSLPRVPLALVAGLLAIAVITFLWRFAKGRFAPIDQRFSAIVRKIERRSHSRGLPDPVLEGWRSWSIELGRRSPEKAGVARRAVTVIHTSFFSGRHRGKETRKRDLAFLTRLYRTLPKRRRRDGREHAPRDRVASRS